MAPFSSCVGGRVAGQGSIAQAKASTSTSCITLDPAAGLLGCTGSLSGRAGVEFAVALDRIVVSTAGRVVVDLAAVDDWSPLVQAITLVVARRLRVRGRELVLLRPSAQLRARTILIDIFDLVPTYDGIAAGARSP